MAAIAALRGRGYADNTVRALRALDPEKINYELAAAVLEWVATRGIEGAILVFMPGAWGCCAGTPRLRACQSSRSTCLGIVITSHVTARQASSRCR
jgi:hypothetical protein